MKIEANSVDEYFENVPEERKPYLLKLRKLVLENIPKGFVEELNYGMPGYVVPHSLFPEGYHCDPKLPLPFLNIANQKNFIGFYHMGIYGDKKLHEWFTAEYPKHCKYKLDMGKSCIRFKRMDDIPYELLTDLVKKITPQDWIEIYKNSLKR